MKPVDSPNNITVHGTALQREKIQLHLPEHRHKFANKEKFTRQWSKPIHWGGRNHNKEELRPSSLKNRDSKHSKLNDRKRQRNMQQMKEHSKNPQDKIKDKEIGSLPGKKFRVMRVRSTKTVKEKKKKKQRHR